MSLLSRIASLLTAVFYLCSCMGPVALSKALPDYDETVNQAVSSALLMNIARSRHNQPPHFTDTTSIVATFNFQADASLGGELHNLSDDSYASLGLGTSVSENPTIELAPLRGDKFAQQLLTPMTDNQFRLLATEGLPLDLLIRLMGKAFHYQDDKHGIIRTVRNDPSIPSEYEHFRQIAVHIGALNALAEIYARRVSFIDVHYMEIPKPPDATEYLNARKSGFVYRHVNETTYSLSQQVIGNTVVTNFDTSILTDEERVALNDQIALTPSNLVDVEIREGFPGGEFAINGAIQLRSISEILTFIGRSISDSPEYHVAPDPRSSALLAKVPGSDVLRYNPPKVLTIDESSRAPDEQTISVRYRGMYYSVNPNEWDELAFKSLYLLMQMSGQASTERAFPITISK